MFYQFFVALEGRRVGLSQSAGTEPAGQMRDEKCTKLWRLQLVRFVALVKLVQLHKFVELV